MITSIDTVKIWSAILQVQKSVGAVEKSGKNPAFKSAYTKIEDLLAALREPCDDAGLVIVQYIDDDMCVTRCVHASSGEFIETHLPMVYDKTTPQGYGAAFTYFKRYALMALFAITDRASDDDDDAASLEKPEEPKPVKTTIHAPVGLPDLGKIKSMSELSALYNSVAPEHKKLVKARIDEVRNG